MQKLLTFFSTKNIGVFEILKFENFNETLTNDVVSFEQPGPGFTAEMCIREKIQKLFPSK